MFPKESSLLYCSDRTIRLNTVYALNEEFLAVYYCCFLFSMRKPLAAFQHFLLKLKSYAVFFMNSATCKILWRHPILMKKQLYLIYSKKRHDSKCLHPYPYVSTDPISIQFIHILRNHK
jgi:hypothetical protein